MRSSATTRNLPDGPPIPRWISVRGDDHPRACTGRKLLALGRARPFSPGRSAARPLTLDPYATEVLSRADRPYALRHGVLVQDCSWNALSSRASSGRERLPSGGGPRRRLPLLLAGNPQHFGRWGELNSVEAMAAALVVLEEREEAASLLEGFRGGLGFLDVNRDRFDRYARARDGREVKRMEREGFDGGGRPTEPTHESVPLRSRL